MDITPEQQDALSEMINIGFGRAAATLSVLIGSRVLLEAPCIEVLSIPELKSTLIPFARGGELIIHQSFKGTLAGTTLMFMDVQSATILLDLLNGVQSVSHTMTDYDREAMIEISNILFNSYIGSFANLLNIPVTFTVPTLSSDTLNTLLERIEESDSQVNYTLLVKTEFHFANYSVCGYVVLIVGIHSMEVLFHTVNEILNR